MRWVVTSAHSTAPVFPRLNQFGAAVVRPSPTRAGVPEVLLLQSLHVAVPGAAGSVAPVHTRLAT